MERSMVHGHLLRRKGARIYIPTPAYSSSKSIKRLSLFARHLPTAMRREFSG
jgi:hypothetical protein